MSKLVSTVLNQLILDKDIAEMELDRLVNSVGTDTNNQIREITKALNKISVAMNSIQLWSSYTIGDNNNNNNNNRKKEEEDGEL